MIGTHGGQRRHWWSSVPVALAVLLVLGAAPVGYFGLTRDDSPADQRAVRSAATTAEETPPASSGSEQERAGVRRHLAVYFGDSLFVSDYNYTNKSNTMARISGRRLGYDKIRVRGGGGTGFVSANEEYNIPPYLQQIRDGALNAPDPDLVVIEGGSNDVHQPKWKIRRNAKLVLRAARSQHPGAKLVLVGPLDVNGDYSDTTPVHLKLRKVAAQEGVPYIDMRRWLEGHYDLVGPDAVHPTAEGHRLLGRKLANALAAVGA